MTNRFPAAIVSVLVMFAVSSSLSAQTSVQSGADLSGVWQPLPTGGERHHFSLEVPPMQPWALDYFNYAKNPTIHMGPGRFELEPRYNCLPPGPTGLMLSPLPFEIIQSPKRVMLFFEHDHWIRQIWTDGRDHPDGYPMTWMGHSSGRWDGGTLVVDTIKINPISKWIDRAGTPHSEDLHVVERFSRPSHDSLRVEFLFEDPKAYTRPWGGTKTYKIGEGWEIQEHIACEDQLINQRGFREDSR